MLTNVLKIINYISILVIGLFVIKVVNEHFSTLEAVTVVMLPILLSLATTITLQQDNKSQTKEIESVVSKLLTTKHIRQHGPKAGIPNQAQFWNSRIQKAEKRFVLCSTTCKSWFDKSEEQSQMIAREILRLIRDDGKVTIITSDSEDVVNMTNSFLQQYLSPLINGLNKAQKLEVKKKLNDTFRYISHSGCKYGATISDDNMLLIPLMNTDLFREESVVLEINQLEYPTLYDNFIGDIDRLANKSKKHNLEKLLFEPSGVITSVNSINI